MTKKPVQIPIDKIDFGIRASLKNFRRINKLASRVLKNDEYLALVLYSYALEEFGKAIYLEESKNNSHNGFIKVKLYDHETKLNCVKKAHSDMIINKLKKTKEKPIKIQYSRIKEATVTEHEETNEDIFPDPLTRTGFWLVDYDENTKHWNEHKNIKFDDEKLKNGISKLYRKIRQIEKHYKIK